MRDLDGAMGTARPARTSVAGAPSSSRGTILALRYPVRFVGHVITRHLRAEKRHVAAHDSSQLGTSGERLARKSSHARMAHSPVDTFDRAAAPLRYPRARTYRQPLPVRVSRATLLTPSAVFAISSPEMSLHHSACGAIADCLVRVVSVVGIMRRSSSVEPCCRRVSEVRRLEGGAHGRRSSKMPAWRLVWGCARGA